MSRWFRYYTESLNDPKVQLLPGDLFKSWVNLLCLCSSQNGKPFDCASVAFALRVSDQKAQGIINELLDRALLDDTDNGLVPHNWAQRQYVSDSSADRVARYRGKRKAAGLPTLGDYGKFRPALRERDGEMCVYCGAESGLVVDHMVPIALGGTDHPDNLALACKPCNSGKSGRTPEQAKMSIRVKTARDALERYRDTQSNVTVSVTPPDTDTEQISEANASDAFASEPPDARLWREGLPALMALGVKERQARPMIGRWRRDAGDDCERVLTAILRAREACPADPIPWINASLKERANGKTESLVAVAKRMASSGVSFGPRPGTVRDGTGGDIVRLLPQGGRE